MAHTRPGVKIFSVAPGTHGQLENSDYNSLEREHVLFKD